MNEIKQVTASDNAVVDRRKWLAEKYFDNVAPALLFKEYYNAYGLSKHSFDKDITVVRSEIGTSVREQYDNIVDDTYNGIQHQLATAVEDGNTSLILALNKQIMELLKLVKEKQPSINTGTIINVQNNGNGNTILPSNLSKDDLYKLLNRTEDTYEQVIDIPVIEQEDQNENGI